MRIFISIDVPEEVKKEIKKIQDELPKFFGKKIGAENLHLTLKFLGEVDEDKIKKVKERLKKINFSEFNAGIKWVGVFSEKFVRIIWLHLGNCEGLQKKIDESLADLFEKEKRFMSHLTIARVKKIEDGKEFLKRLKDMEIPKIEFVVRSFNLKKSILTGAGPVYETLENYDLKRKYN